MKSKKNLGFLLLLLLSANVSLKCDDQVEEFISDIQESTFCEENKNVLIAAGASVLTLSVGALGGSYFMKWRKDRELDEKNKALKAEKNKTKPDFSKMKEIEKKEKDFEALNKDLENARNGLVEKEEQAKALQQNIEELGVVANQKKEEIKDIRVQLDGVQGAKGDLQVRYDNVCKERTDIQGAIEELQRVNATVNGELQRKTEDLELAECKMVALQDESFTQKKESLLLRENLKGIFQVSDEKFKQDVLIPLEEQRQDLDAKLTELQSKRSTIDLTDVAKAQKRERRIADKREVTEGELKDVLEQIDRVKQQHEQNKRRVEEQHVVQFLREVRKEVENFLHPKVVE